MPTKSWGLTSHHFDQTHKELIEKIKYICFRQLKMVARISCDVEEHHRRRNMTFFTKGTSKCTGKPSYHSFKSHLKVRLSVSAFERTRWLGFCCPRSEVYTSQPPLESCGGIPGASFMLPYTLPASEPKGPRSFPSSISAQPWLPHEVVVTN